MINICFGSFKEISGLCLFQWFFAKGMKRNKISLHHVTIFWHVIFILVH